MVSDEQPSNPAGSAATISESSAAPVTGAPESGGPASNAPATPLYFNRELSWLAFNRRVLAQAESNSYPLLERMRFLSFTSSNLDEFFEIRVAGLLQQRESGTTEVGPDGLSPREQLKRIAETTQKMVRDQYACWQQQIVPEFKEKGIVFKSRDELTSEENEWVKRYFAQQVYPVLTPLAFDPAHPFPQIGNKELNILVWLDDPDTPETETFIAVVPIPRILPRVVRLDLRPDYTPTYVFLSDIVKTFADQLFSGYRVRGAWAFRITRNSDLYIDEEEVKNLLHKIEQELVNRKRGAAVRLEIEAGVNPFHLSKLIEETELPPDFVYLINGPINLLRLFTVYDVIDRPDLKFKPVQPFVHPQLRNKHDFFDNISQQDFLLHHPFESFDPVVDFISWAAEDPGVFAIKQTLYRTSGDSPITKALMRASENGKQVTVLVELKARFDEANNIQWARMLEEAGVHVVYGIVGLKTHCKLCLVVRREPKGLKLYSHLGTGNYNPKTARAYTDFSFFTAREDITSEVAEVFNALTGFAREPEFSKLWVAPYNLHNEVIRWIKREEENAQAGKKARIMVKANSLIDKPVIDELYLASQAGVQIDLIIRGICGLVPGVPGLSENIRVRSILGRYLEHSRVFYFENSGGQPIIMLGSADWMQRNFYRRIESIFPLEDPRLRERVMHEVFDTYLRDNTFAHELQSDGSYLPAENLLDPEDDAPFSAQNHLSQRAEYLRQKTEKAAQA